ncbi:MAG: hypothetical protein F4Y03_00450 [Alphaproteobacteria bacterium]|nr:hypothetical protein [Alphaproteobacteria bacterium]
MTIASERRSAVLADVRLVLTDGGWPLMDDDVPLATEDALQRLAASLARHYPRIADAVVEQERP